LFASFQTATRFQNSLLPLSRLPKGAIQTLQPCKAEQLRKNVLAPSGFLSFCFPAQSTGKQKLKNPQTEQEPKNKEGL
jgi:hypothetical protein